MTGTASGGLDERLEAFLDRCVESVAALEVLVFLSTSGRVTRRDVVRRMAFEPTMVDLAISQLGRHHLVTVDDDGRVGFTPTGPSSADVVADLAAAYRVRRTAVIARIIRDRDPG